MAFDVKITTFSNVLDLIAPHSCRGCGRLGNILCGCCKNYNISLALNLCARCKQPIKKCHCKVPVYTFAWREGLLRDLVEEYKYQSIRATAPVLADFLDATLPDNLGTTSNTPASCAPKTSDSTTSLSPVTIVPLPTIPRHIRERGFDHTLLLAKKLSKKRQNFSVESLLIRQESTVQVGANEQTRKKQARSAYALKKDAKLSPNTTYLLLDDVWTTGASMEAAISILEKAGARHLASAVLVASR